jgi:hypothetical protein
MLITILLLSVLNTALALLALVRTGRTFLSLNDLSNALVDVFNFQNRQVKKLGETIESAMDALLIADYEAAASSTGQDAEN